MSKPANAGEVELGRITVRHVADSQGEQIVYVDLDREEIPYLTAHGMLSMATESLPSIYSADDTEEGDID